MKRKIILTISIIAVLIIFFYPRDCGDYANLIPEKSTQGKICTCIGIRYSPLMEGGGQPITCFGLPASDSCYKIEWNVTETEEGVSKEPLKIDIPCE